MNIDKFLIRAEAKNGYEIYKGYYKHNDGDYISIGEGSIYQMAIAIKPETIKRCIGYKDKNGELIFEGDIIHKFPDKYKVLISETNNEILFRDEENNITITMSNMDFDIEEYEIIDPKEERFKKYDGMFKDDIQKQIIGFNNNIFNANYIYLKTEDIVTIDKETLDFINKKVEELKLFKEKE